MSAQVPSGNAEPRQRGGPRTWLSHIVVPTIVAVVGAVLVTALTPLGENLRELIFPTHAVLTGTVTVDGRGVAQAPLSLDGAPVGLTGENGTLMITDVRAGTHVLHIEAFGAVPADRSFVVPREATVVDLKTVELLAVAHLGFHVSLTPQKGRPKIDYEVALWIDADKGVLADIDKVRYYMPEPLPAKPVKGKKRSNSFCYTKAGTLDITDFFGPAGSLGAARAEMTLAGTPLKLTGLPTDARPPEGCPAASQTGGGSGSSGGGGGGNSGGGGGGSGTSGGGGGTGEGGTDSPSGGAANSPSPSGPVVISCSFAEGGETYQTGPDESIHVGQEVRWINSAEESMSLGITDSPPGWDSAATGELAPGESYSFTFTESGSHQYTCVYSAHKISGDLVVDPN